MILLKKTFTLNGIYSTDKFIQPLTFDVSKFPKNKRLSALILHDKIVCKIGKVEMMGWEAPLGPREVGE